MWLKDSSIGRKFIMSLSGLALVLFLIFHGCMNLAVVFSEEAYNTICHLLGANWYALIGTVGLAFLVVLHFCYAIYLTIQNRAARGNDRYAVTGKKEGVEFLRTGFPGASPLQLLVQNAVGRDHQRRYHRCVRSSERCGLCKGLVHYSC